MSNYIKSSLLVARRNGFVYAFITSIKEYIMSIDKELIIKQLQKVMSVIGSDLLENISDRVRKELNLNLTEQDEIRDVIFKFAYSDSKFKLYNKPNRPTADNVGKLHYPNNKKFETTIERIEFA